MVSERSGLSRVRCAAQKQRALDSPDRSEGNGSTKRQGKGLSGKARTPRLRPERRRKGAADLIFCLTRPAFSWKAQRSQRAKTKDFLGVLFVSAVNRLALS